MPRKKAVPKRKRKMGRPRIEFDLVELTKLTSIGCTDREIAGFFDCSVETVDKRKQSDPEFLQALTKGRMSCKRSLRRMQWKAAEGGNVTMMIWLGKQLLDQRDHREPPRVPLDPKAKHSAVLQDDVDESPLDDA